MVDWAFVIGHVMLAMAVAPGYRRGRPIGGGAAGGTPANGYVTEDGTTVYVAEDGTTFYVQE